MLMIYNQGSNCLLRLLSNNQRSKNKAAGRLSMGERITSAADDAAGYQISEKMRTQIRGLRQCNANTRTADSLLGAAEGALQQMTELVKGMKELAIKAANGVYTETDRMIMDEEYQQYKEQIDEIANTANYNGIPLLDGTWRRKQGTAVRGGGGATRTISAPSVPAGSVTDSVVGGTREITITADGAFTIPRGFTGNIRVQSANVLLRQETADALTNVSIDCDAGTNLIIEDLNIETVNNTERPGKSIIEFTGAGNTLTLCGSNALIGKYRGGASVPLEKTLTAASLIHVGVGTELTVQEHGTAYLNMEKRLTGEWGPDDGAVFGGNREETCGTIIINSGNLYVKNGRKSDGAAIGSGTQIYGGDSANGTIIINGGRVEAHADDGAAIGGASNKDSGTMSITINGGIVEAYIDGGYTNGGSAIGNGGISDENLVFTITGGKVTAVIDKRRTLTSIPLTQNPIGNGVRGGGSATIHDDGAVYREWEDANQRVGVYEEMPWVEPAPVLPDWLGPHPQAASTITGGLRFQMDPRASFYNVCFIEDMSVRAIGLDDTHIRTGQAASELLSGSDDVGRMEKALQVILAETTSVGAYRARLFYTEQNLTTAEENTVAAESTLRDADTAKEMVNYVKNNILLQSTQAMMAQTNGNAERVLTLLK